MNDEEGFTLPELLVGMLILTLIIGVIANCFILGLRTTDSATKSFAHSRDARLFSSFFETDVETARTVETSAQCGAGSGTHILSFKWVDEKEDGSNSANSVSYYTTVSGSETRLVRRVCAGASVVEVTVAHELIAASPVTTSCDGVACSSNSTPAAVTATLAEADSYTFSITGRRRVS